MSDDPVTRILRRDPRFARAAYEFVVEALREAIGSGEQPRHVTARELLEAIRTLAAREFGPLARTVLADWGVRSTQDFGEIVFHLIDEQELRKTESDLLSDFDDVFDFAEAFPDDTGEVRVHVAEDDEEWDAGDHELETNDEA